MFLILMVIITFAAGFMCVGHDLNDGGKLYSAKDGIHPMGGGGGRGLEINIQGVCVQNGEGYPFLDR